MSFPDVFLTDIIIDTFNTVQRRLYYVNYVSENIEMANVDTGKKTLILPSKCPAFGLAMDPNER